MQVVKLGFTPNEDGIRTKARGLDKIRSVFARVIGGVIDRRRRLTRLKVRNWSNNDG